MCRTERFGEVEFFLQQVNGNNLPCPRECGALNDVESDTTTANDRNGRPRPDLSGVDCRTDTGHRAAPHKTGTIEGHIVSDLDRTALWHYCLFRKRSGVREMKDISPALAQARRAIEQRAERLRPCFTEMRCSLGTRE